MKSIKRYFKSVYMSLGMFSAIPLPFQLWNNDCMNLILACFPIIGGIIGVLWWIVLEMLTLANPNLMLSAAVTTVFPFFLTGFLHLDGYMDTSDAVLSRRSLEDKLRILKDPHTGAFSVIMIATLFLLQFATLYTIIEKGEYFSLLIVITIISRCCSSISLLYLKTLAQSGYVNMFKQNTGIQHKIFVIFIAVLVALVSFVYFEFVGLIVILSVILGYCFAMAYVYKEFKGVSGDLTGFAIVISELCGLFAIALM